MTRLKVQAPEIPEEGFFTNWASNIISGGDEELKHLLFSSKRTDI